MPVTGFARTVVAFIGFLAISVLAAAQPPTLIVIQQAPITVLPDATRTPLYVAPVGKLLIQVGVEGDWFIVQFNDSRYGRRNGYIQSRFVRVNRPATLDQSARPTTTAPPQVMQPTAPTPLAATDAGSSAAGRGHVAAPGSRATIVTKQGETVSGALVATTPEGLTLSLGGQPIVFRFENISSVNFGAEPSAPTGATTAVLASSTKRASLDAALRALSELQAATEIGVLRPQYSEKLIETLTRVKAFTDAPGTDWADIRLAMLTAINYYQQPLADLDNWKDAPTSWASARPWVEYSRRLASSDAPDHEEWNTASPLELNQSVTGRLGMGDRKMPSSLDRSSAGHFNDVYVLKLDAPATVVITMRSPLLSPHLTLLDAWERRIEANAGFFGDSTIKRKLAAGTHYIWAGSMGDRFVGTYSLSVNAQP